MKWSAKNRIYVMVVFIVVSCVAFYFFGFRYLKQSIQTESDKYIELKKNSILLEAKGRALRSLEEQYGKIREDIPRIEKTALNPSQEDILGFLVLIEGFEQRAGVRVATTINDPVEDAHIGLMVFPFDMKIYGSYSNVYKFMTYFQNASQSIRIEKVEFSKNASTQFYIGDVAMTANEGDVELIVASKILSSVSVPQKDGGAGQKKASSNIDEK
jgi:Tfp pilus assembly protein PilO